MMNEWWGVVCAVGFWGWVVSALGLTLAGFPSANAIDTAKARRWGVCLTVLFLLWIVGMLKG